jgi:hypothetical protein
MGVVKRAALYLGDATLRAVVGSFALMVAVEAANGVAYALHRRRDMEGVRD